MIIDIEMACSICGDAYITGVDEEHQFELFPEPCDACQDVLWEQEKLDHSGDWNPFDFD